MTSAPQASTDHLAVAHRVLTTEASALQVLADNLPKDLPAAVDHLQLIKGRIVVCGIGKSGHVARKIAATLASTGTPSFFVHPSEASHGDLGKIMPEDACILLSNSGETSELRDVIDHCLRFEVPIVGISSNPDSSLMRFARYRLAIPQLPEACAIGKAPTTSTTTMMALGDALAVALMEARKFGLAHFREFHPGGQLGAQLTPLAQIMYGPEALPLIGPEAPMSAALAQMSDRGFGLVGVTDAEGLLRGVISDGDLRRNIDGILDRAPLDIANPNPVTATPDTLAAEALALINRTKIGALFVCENGRPVGILHLHDLLRLGVK